MGANWLLLIIGLTICMGGIYFRRLTSGLLGLLNGLIIAFVVLLITGGLMEYGDDTATVIAIFVVFGFAVLSAIYYKVITIINAFIAALILVAVFLLVLGTGLLPAIIVALLVAVGLCILLGKFYDIGFIVLTALFGGFIAAIGGHGILHGITLDELLGEILFGEAEGMGGVFLLAVVFATCGAAVQRYRFFGKGGQGVKNFIKRNTPNGKPSAPNIFGNTTQKMSSLFTANINYGNRGIINEKTAWLLAPPIIAFLLCPWCAYMDFSYNMILFLRYSAESIALAYFVYFVLQEEVFWIDVYIGIYIVGFILEYLFSWYVEDDGILFFVVMILRYPLIYLATPKQTSISNNKNDMLLIIGILEYIIYHFILFGIACMDFFVYSWFVEIVVIIVFVVAFYYIYQKRENIDITSNQITINNSVASNTNNRVGSPGSAVKSKSIQGKNQKFFLCPGCGALVSSDSAECSRCKRKL